MTKKINKNYLKRKSTAPDAYDRAIAKSREKETIDDRNSRLFLDAMDQWSGWLGVRKIREQNLHSTKIEHSRTKEILLNDYRIAVDKVKRVSKKLNRLLEKLQRKHHNF